jgi:hypothetical protein
VGLGASVGLAASVGFGASVGGTGVAAGLQAANTREAVTSKANRIDIRRFIFFSSPWGEFSCGVQEDKLDNTTFLTVRQGNFGLNLIKVWLSLCKKRND